MKKLVQQSLMAISASLLVACTTDSTEQTVAQTPEKKEKVVMTTSKTTAPISMKYQLLTQSPKAGEEIEIAISFDSSIQSEVKSSMTSAEKLTWLNAKTSWQSGMSKTGQRESLPTLKVVAPKDGIYYISFVATVEYEGKTLARPFTIPVQVGDGPFEKAQKDETVVDDKGQRVIIQKGESDNG